MPNPPGPTGLPVVGVLPQYMANPLTLFANSARRYGNAVRLPLLNQTAYLFSHPDHVKHILVDNSKNYHHPAALADITKPVTGEGLLISEGEQHLQQRRLLQPAFHQKQVDDFAGTMVQFTDEHCRQWQPDQALDLYREINKMTVRITAHTLFGVDTGIETEALPQALHILMDHIDILEAIPPGRWFHQLPGPRQRREKLLRVLDDAIYGLIEQQQHQPHETNMVSILLAAQSGDGANAGLARRQIRDEVTTFFIAGQETIANVIAWAFYLLGRHPAVRAQLAEELDRVLGGKLPTAADIPNLVYTRMVFAETMRLFPSVWAIGRSPLADDEIGGYQIPAGSLVFVSQWVVHRHPDYWPEANLFKPQRFHPGSLARTKRPRYAYFPFGGGPRLCIGEHYAWMEGILMIATLAQRFQFKIAPQAHIEPQPLLTLRLKYGLPVIVQQPTTSVPSPG